MAGNIDERILQYDYEWREGDREKAKQIAKDYVNERRDELSEKLEKYTREELVRMVEGYRAANMEADRIVCDMWLMSEYEPTRIVGVMNVGGRQVLEAVEAILRGEGESLT